MMFPSGSMHPKSTPHVSMAIDSGFTPRFPASVKPSRMCPYSENISQCKWPFTSIIPLGKRLSSSAENLPSASIEPRMVRPLVAPRSMAMYCFFSIMFNWFYWLIFSVCVKYAQHFMILHPVATSSPSPSTDASGNRNIATDTGPIRQDWREHTDFSPILSPSNIHSPFRECTH